MSKIGLADGSSLDFQVGCPSLLDALEQHQLEVSYHCRAGFCGACRCKLLHGRIRYLQEPLAFVRKGEFLPCCSVPDGDIEIEIP